MIGIRAESTQYIVAATANSMKRCTNFMPPNFKITRIAAVKPRTRAKKKTALDTDSGFSNAFIPAVSNGAARSNANTCVRSRSKPIPANAKTFPRDSSSISLPELSSNACMRLTRPLFLSIARRWCPLPPPASTV
nr:hypothetical protein [Methanophagales archaeon]